MLDTLLRELGWYKHPRGSHITGIHAGTLKITGGSITLPHVKEGQYFRIVGSVFNDGVYQHPVADLTDEVFDGAAWALRIPPDVVALAADIQAWCKSNGGEASPYVSETYPNGYSYTRAVDQNGVVPSWQSVFASRMSQWRKI